MAGPEIVMQTPAAKQLELAVQRKLAEFAYSTADDVVMAEYVVVMLANSKTPDQITAELTELIGEDMYDPGFTTWLFEEVRRQYGLPPSETATRSPAEPAEQPSHQRSKSKDNNEGEVGVKIETVDDSRDNQNARRGPVKRPGNGSTPVRSGHGVFNQAVGGLKRPSTNDLYRDTPPHRRPRHDDQFSGGPIPTGPRLMDRNPRDPNRQNNHGIHPGSGPMANRRDTNNGHLPNPGHVLGAESAGKSILERVGMINNTSNMNNNSNRPFQNPNFQGGFDGRSQSGNSPFRRNNDQVRGSPSDGRPPIPPSTQPMFYGVIPPFQAPNLPFPQQPFNNQGLMHSTTPQLFLANGQPFIPQQYQLPGSNGIIHPAMYSHPLFNPAAVNNPAPPAHQSSNPAAPLKAETAAPVATASNQPSENDLASLPSKPLLRQECKYNLSCKNAWCPSSHCSPEGNPKSSLLLSFDPCEKQLQCTDPDCSKAHVSPQQRDPQASIRLPTSTKPASVAPVLATPTYSTGFSSAQATNLTPCRFGINCARHDCVFSHPWKTKPSNGTATVDSDVSKNSFSSIPCKFGTACARPACHFQHPATAPGSTIHRIPSKNITKTFTNGTDGPPSGALGSSNPEKLSPSKKFSPAEQKPNTSTTSNGTSSTAVKVKAEDGDEEKKKTEQLNSNNNKVIQTAPVTSAPVVNATSTMVS